MILLFIPAIILAQSDDDQKEIEKRLRRITKSSEAAPEAYTRSTYHLATYLTQDAQSDLEKVRSFYVWIANNITYDMVGYKTDKYPDARPKAVLYNRVAVCDGYAKLFSELCAEAGVRAEVIYGYSKGYGYEKGQIFDVSNHAWNAVVIDDEWKLIDVTWAARETNEVNLVRPLDDSYFLTEPNIFVEDHLPEIPAWQLLSNPVSKSDFESSQITVTPGRYNFNDSLRMLLTTPSTNRTITYQLMAREFNPNNDVANYELGLEYRFQGLDTLEAIYKVDKPDTVLFDRLEKSAFTSFGEAALYFTLIKPGSRYYESAQVFLDDTDFEKGVFKYEVAHRVIELYNMQDEESKKNQRDKTEQLILRNYEEARAYFELIPRHSWYFEKAQEYLNIYLKNPFEPD